MIKRLFSVDIHAGFMSPALLVTRLMTAGFMLTHGIPKLNKLMAGGEIKFGDPLGLGPEVSLFLAVFAEFFCSLCIGLGLGTRLAAIPLVITMAVAAFIAHGDDPFQRKELALLYLTMYIILIFSGSGKFSVDYFISGGFRKK